MSGLQEPRSFLSWKRIPPASLRAKLSSSLPPHCCLSQGCLLGHMLVMGPLHLGDVRAAGFELTLSVSPGVSET